MKMKLFGLILFAAFTINTQAQGASSDSYAKQFAKDSANASHKKNNAFSKGYKNKYNAGKSSTTPRTRCRTTAAERKAGKSCTYEK